MILIKLTKIFYVWLMIISCKFYYSVVRNTNIESTNSLDKFDNRVYSYKPTFIVMKYHRVYYLCDSIIVTE